MVFNYGSVGSSRYCPEDCIKNAYKYFFYFLHKYAPTHHYSDLPVNALSSNCSLVVWYYVNVLQRNKTKRTTKKFFDEYIDYFTDMRASCSEGYFMSRKIIKLKKLLRLYDDNIGKI